MLDSDDSRPAGISDGGASAPRDAVDLDEAQLVEAARLGDADAFTTLFRRWFDPCCDVSRRILRADDLAQCFGVSKSTAANKSKQICDKLNIGALGNLVPQLHIHHIVRRVDDPAWPGPVWGHSPAEPYPERELGDRLLRLREALGLA